VRWSNRYELVLMALVITGADAPQPPTGVVREERTVEVAGAAEVWRLEWLGETYQACSAADTDGWYTCPCSGFEFGESGELDLVRSRESKELQRLHLTPLFLSERTPADGLATLRRWPRLEGDIGRQEDPGFVQMVEKRALVPILELHDYNHDGWATEFVLQVGTLPCGRHEAVLVGVSPDRPQLHAFTSVEQPSRPLVMYVRHWESLRDSSGSMRVVAWTCGDHGSEIHHEYVVQADKSGIHATRELFACDSFSQETVPGEPHGKLIQREPLCETSPCSSAYGISLDAEEEDAAPSPSSKKP